MTIARETASQMALRTCSEDVGGKVSIDVISVKGGREVKLTVWQNIASSHKKRTSLLRILCFAEKSKCDGKDPVTVGGGVKVGFWHKSSEFPVKCPILFKIFSS